MDVFSLFLLENYAEGYIKLLPSTGETTNTVLFTSPPSGLQLLFCVVLKNKSLKYKNSKWLSGKKLKQTKTLQLREILLDFLALLIVYLVSSYSS